MMGMKQYLLIYNSRSFMFEKNKDDGEVKMDSWQAEFHVGQEARWHRGDNTYRVWR